LLQDFLIFQNLVLNDSSHRAKELKLFITTFLLKMKKITILGANTLLGHHLVTVVDNVFSGIDKTLWNYNDKRDGLKEAIEGSGMVF